jgi:hypothetical protein
MNMGYGEVGGGGSLLWQFHYDRDERRERDPVCPLNRRQYHGRDPEVETGSRLLMAVDGEVIGTDANGRLVIEVKLSHDPRQVQLYWGNDLGDAPKVQQQRSA